MHVNRVCVGGACCHLQRPCTGDVYTTWPHRNTVNDDNLSLLLLGTIIFKGKVKLLWSLKAKVLPFGVWNRGKRERDIL